jgi:hypothetical protein
MVRWLKRKEKNPFRVKMEWTTPTEGVYVVWAVLLGPGMPDIGIWIKVAEGDGRRW